MVERGRICYEHGFRKYLLHTHCIQNNVQEHSKFKRTKILILLIKTVQNSEYKNEIVIIMFQINT